MAVAVATPVEASQPAMMMQPGMVQPMMMQPGMMQPNVTGMPNLAEQLAQLHTMHQNGVLNDAQFEAAKANILSSGGVQQGTVMTTTTAQPLQMGVPMATGVYVA